MVWFPPSWFYLSRKKCIVGMFSCFKKSEKKFAKRGLFISAMSHVKLIAETRVYICHKNMKSIGIFFLQFFDHIDASAYKMPSCYSAVIFNTKGSRCKGWRQDGFATGCYPYLVTQTRGFPTYIDSNKRNNGIRFVTGSRDSLWEP